MSTETEVKLLTLLNVSAIKKPRDLDIPGGQRGSPSLQGTSGNNSAVGSPAAVPTSSKGTKKRKGVKFGGELGPSGSLFGKKAKQVENAKASADMSGNGKGKGKEVNGNGNGESHAEKTGHLDIDVDEGSDDEAAGVPSEPIPLAIIPSADHQAIDSTSISDPLPSS